MQALARPATACVRGQRRRPCVFIPASVSRPAQPSAALQAPPIAWSRGPACLQPQPEFSTQPSRRRRRVLIDAPARPTQGQREAWAVALTTILFLYGSAGQQMTRSLQNVPRLLQELLRSSGGGNGNAPATGAAAAAAAAITGEAAAEEEGAAGVSGIPAHELAVGSRSSCPLQLESFQSAPHEVPLPLCVFADESGHSWRYRPDEVQRQRQAAAEDEQGLAASDDEDWWG